MSELDTEIIIALAENNMKISAAARSLFMHRNTAVYHIERVKKITGLDPTNFYHLCKLVQMVRERRADDGQ